MNDDRSIAPKHGNNNRIVVRYPMRNTGGFDNMARSEPVMSSFT